MEAKRKACVLQASYKDSQSIIKDLDLRRNLLQWMPKGWEVEHVFLDAATAVKQLMQVKADVYINLCDGAWDEDAPGIDVVRALERFKRAFTGSGSKFYDPTREEMKQFCTYWQIPTPRYGFVFAEHYEEDVTLILKNLKFPMFVKHYHGYNSVGITEKSKVKNEAELREQVKIMVDNYGGALIEEFIDGREFSVLVASNPNDDQNPLVFKPVECVFDEGINFKTFDYKWNGAKNPWTVVEDPATTTQFNNEHRNELINCLELTKKLQKITIELFLAMGGEGYARTDIRMDKDGNLYLLEINPNCSVFYPDDNGATADVILMLDGAGKSFFLEKMIEFALKRHKKQQLPYRVQLDPKVGNCLIATKNIAPGELIYQLEEMPHRLVSKARVEKMWNARLKQFFTDYCWPISEELWVMWDLEPEGWKPINHSCDPNAWVEGLDLVARKPIQRGEEITMDYGTMYAIDQGPQFECKCGSSLCRGGWKADDYKQPWFEERYGDGVNGFGQPPKNGTTWYAIPPTSSYPPPGGYSAYPQQPNGYQQPYSQPQYPQQLPYNTTPTTSSTFAYPPQTSSYPYPQPPNSSSNQVYPSPTPSSVPSSTTSSTSSAPSNPQPYTTQNSSSTPSPPPSSMYPGLYSSTQPSPQPSTSTLQSTSSPTSSTSVHCTDASKDKKGFLLKRGGTLTVKWQKRFVFFVKNSRDQFEVVYQLRQNGGERGRFIISGAKVDEVPFHCLQKNNVFSIRPIYQSSRKEYYFQAESRDQMLEWIAVAKKASGVQEQNDVSNTTASTSMPSASTSMPSASTPSVSTQSAPAVTSSSTTSGATNNQPTSSYSSYSSYSGYTSNGSLPTQQQQTASNTNTTNASQSTANASTAPSGGAYGDFTSMYAYRPEDLLNTTPSDTTTPPPSSEAPTDTLSRDTITPASSDMSRDGITSSPYDGSMDSALPSSRDAVTSQPDTNTSDTPSAPNF